jgi:hypothetical protein
VPANKGRRLPAPVLSREEVGAVFDAFRSTRAVDARDKALLWLAYRYRLKLVQLVGIDTSGYDAAHRELTVPATTRHPASTISLDSMTTELLDRWMAVRKSLGIRPFAPLFCTAVADSLGRPVSPSYLRGKLAELGRTAGVQRRVTLEGLRASGKTHFTDPPASIELLIERHVSADAFRARHPEAHEKWSDAQVFFRVGPERYATQIGHNCREALAALANGLVRQYQIAPDGNAGTVDKLRSVLAVSTRSPTERRFVNALLSYWRSVSDLAQRQEHAGLHEGETPRAEDARRLVFQTLLVMYEVDRATVAS